MAGLWSATTLPEPNNGVSFDGGNGHLTGWGAAPTIDQIVAQAYGAACRTSARRRTRARRRATGTIALGVQCGNPNSVTRMCYTAVNAPVNPEVSPKAAFDRYFMGVTGERDAAADGGSGGDAGAQRAEGRRRSAEGRPVAHPQADRRRRLPEDRRAPGRRARDGEAHRAAADHADPTVGCAVPPSPTTVTSNSANYPTQVTQMMDIAAHILACDVTRVLTLQLSRGFSNIMHTWLGHTSGHHTMSHDGMDRRTELTGDRQLVREAGRVPARQAGCGERGDRYAARQHAGRVGARAWQHLPQHGAACPFIMAGKAGGALRTGRFLNFDGRSTRSCWSPSRS